MRYVGITGFVSREEVDFALSCLPAGLTLMCGILVSAKTLQGRRPRLWRRYPHPNEAAAIFSPDPRCLNLIHFCADEPPTAATVSRLQAIGGEHCHGFQFNVAYPEPSTLAALAGGHVVLQVRPERTPMIQVHSAVRALRNCDVTVLIDGSGGEGREMDSDVFDMWAMTIRGHFGNDVGLAFAGGLDADSLPRIASEVRTWGASIDAEGRLRDSTEGGGILDRTAVAAYLARASEIMTPEKNP